MASLRWRLPLLMTALVAAVLSTFVWAAHRTLRTTLLHEGEDRLQVASSQLAAIVARDELLATAQRNARAPVLASFLADPTDAEKRAAAERFLASIVAGASRRHAELWSLDGTRLAEAASGDALPAVTEVGADGVGPLRSLEPQAADAMRRQIFYDIVAGVPARAAGERAGTLVVRMALLPTNPRVISRLVGEDAYALLGNADGSLWTDLNAPVHVPLGGRNEGVSSYDDGSGHVRVGAATPVPGAPWVAWIEFPRDSLLRPADDFLDAIVPLAVIFLIAGAALALAVSSSITVPLVALSGAADDVAAGDYSRRVRVDRHDEVGRLAHAFNLMTSEIQESHRTLESRVAARTAELAAARAEADRANRAKSEFLSLMSHDLRTPLNAILGFAQLLETETLTPAQREHVSHILSGGRHLLSLVSDVLDIARIESGQLGLAVAPVAVQPLAREAAELVGPMAAARNITVRFDEAALDDVAVMADAQRLSQILLNLLSNAVKYNREGGDVFVTGQRVGGRRYRVAVRDTGPGIQSDRLGRLFQPFERLGAEQTSIEGTGLGLALSRALASVMHGTMGMASREGEGSTFWVELPLADVAAPVNGPAPDAVPEVPTPPTTGVVLYVEDNPSNVRLLQRILERRPGVTLLEAGSGAAGLTLAREQRPDLILLDMHLPDTSGADVLALLTADARTRDIPKVIVTADATPGLGERLEAAGARACITKPLNVPAMLALIDRLLPQPRTTSDV